MTAMFVINPQYLENEARGHLKGPLYQWHLSQCICRYALWHERSIMNLISKPHDMTSSPHFQDLCHFITL